MSDLTLYTDAGWESPWVFHAVVALEELGLPFRVEALALPIEPATRHLLRDRALLGKVPCLAHGELWLTESLAISEYLAERFPPPRHPSLLPDVPPDRARARQIMSWLRTSLTALRADRPTTSVFARPVTTALGEKARADAEELIRVAEQAIPRDRMTLAPAWSIADADLALALARLVANRDSVPARLADYVATQWQRPSVRAFLARVPPAA